MSKKRYSLYLDEQQTEELKPFLAQRGISFSGLINTLISELLNDFKGQPVFLSKKVEDMTVREFGEAMQYWNEKSSGCDSEPKDMADEISELD